MRQGQPRRRKRSTIVSSFHNRTVLYVFHIDVSSSKMINCGFDSQLRHQVETGLRMNRIAYLKTVVDTYRVKVAGVGS
jgi:hypothetical protein